MAGSQVFRDYGATASASAPPENAADDNPTETKGTAQSKSAGDRDLPVHARKPTRTCSSANHLENIML